MVSVVVTAHQMVCGQSVDMGEGRVVVVVLMDGRRL